MVDDRAIVILPSDGVCVDRLVELSRVSSIRRYSLYSRTPCIIERVRILRRSRLGWSSTIVTWCSTVTYVYIGLYRITVTVLPCDSEGLTVIVDIDYRTAVSGDSLLTEGLGCETCVGLGDSGCLCSRGTGFGLCLSKRVSITYQILLMVLNGVSRIGVGSVLCCNRQVGCHIVELIVPTREGIALACRVCRCRRCITAIDGVGLEESSIVVAELNEIERIVAPEAFGVTPTGYLIAVVRRRAVEVRRLVPLIIPVTAGSSVRQADEDDLRVVIYLRCISLTIGCLCHQC